MLRIRPVRTDDHKEVLELAHIAGIGMSSLPQDAEVLRGKIANAVASFNGKAALAAREKFLLVLEDMAKKRLVGTTAIIAHVGLTRPFYSYKLSTITQASSELEIYSLQQVLHMVNDYTDATEVGSLFLHPDYRRDGIGRFLSRSRYLMLAEFPELFSDIVISEIRGVQDEKGNSPFYDNLARHFFKMEFRQADYVYATKGTQFIADLMPKYPIYVNLLPQEAQAVIGVPLEASKGAQKLLKTEGFHYEGYVDLFDAGPTMQADRPNIRTVRKSHKVEVKDVKKIQTDPHIVCNARLKDFMCVSGSIEIDGDTAIITPDMAEALGIKKGDAVRYAL